MLGGGESSDGGVPSIGTRISNRFSMVGIDSSSPHVYGCCAPPKMSGAAPYSIARPAYITITCVAVSATTPRSCVIRITPTSNSFFTLSIS